ncbi:MAG: N-succinylarginine dihydrolase [Planctomycetales bacterium]|nr:N-succinylarginine dihydrolase [Planctomycetales bacterium]
MLTEINIDALVGPTHHYGGLGVGNIASQEHAYRESNPRAAALEGLEKASLLASLGVPQFIFLPPRRPRLQWLQQLGFEGPLPEQLQAALQTAPHILSAAFSSAFMWAANSATVSAATDTRDGRPHATPANLLSSWHRGGEAQERTNSLRSLLAPSGGRVHSPLPSIVPLRDEGAANHMRLCDRSGRPGLNVFVYGDAGESPRSLAGFFPRQTRAACEAIARQHQLSPETTFFLAQHPQAIAAGVFHNDVIATSHEHLLLYHELAFLDAEPELQRLQQTFEKTMGKPLLRIEVSQRELPLPDAVRSYLFNSQIVTPGRAPAGSQSPQMAWVCPAQCRRIEAARQVIERLLNDPSIPLEQVHYISLDQSMAGGGGPACLRLRLPLASTDIAALPLRLDDALEQRLREAIERWYPTRLHLADFGDSQQVEALLAIPDQLQRLARAN